MSEEQNLSRDLETRGYLILETCPECVVLVDRNWSVVYANPTFRLRFGGPKSVEGTSFLSYLDGPSALRLRDLQPQLMRGGRQVEVSHTKPDGHAAPLQYSFFPLSVGGNEALLAGVGRDRAGDLASLLEIIQLNTELERKQKELSEANARLEQLAVTDQITALYNRHYFFQVAQHFWEESRRYKLPLVVILMDIDNFKAVNDTYGHLFGDHVLQQVSVRLRNNTRKSDIVARYGGEELIVLASNTDLQTGMVLAERLRLAVASEPFVMGNCVATVTLSVGVSGTELGDFRSFEALLDSSDQALYGAKRAGKNCVYTYVGSAASQP